MKKLLILVCAIAFVACTKPAPAPSPICPFAGIGVKMVTDQVVAKIKTCNSQKMANKVLALLNCPTAAAKSIDLSVIKTTVCPVVVNLLGTVAGTAASSADMDCDPAVISALVKDANLCNLLFKINI